jgi:ABC-type glutathione transport system ATPase component
MAAEPLLVLQGYSLQRADGTTVLADLDLSLAPGEILGVVGESGSGKSQLLLSLLGLAMTGASTRGSCRFDGCELVGAAQSQWAPLRGRHIAMLFQDPLLTWNPYLTIGRQLTEVLEQHAGLSRQAAEPRVCRALEEAGLSAPQDLLRRHPHELSGGMRQRALLAMAMLGEPRLLLADEPTTALDASTQLAVLDRLDALRRERGMAVLLVTHDLGVVARVADRVLVLRAGRIVEQGPTLQVLTAPQSDYARSLVDAARRMDAAGALS